MTKGYKSEINGQMIALMGIILAISVFTISSLAAEIANIDFIVSTGGTNSLQTEFNNIKETFGITLNYNLIDINVDENNETYFEGNIDELNKAFQQTVNESYNILYKQGIVFDAILYGCESSDELKIQGHNTVFYKVDITLSLDNGDSYIRDDVSYQVACSPKMS